MEDSCHHRIFNEALLSVVDLSVPSAIEIMIPFSSKIQLSRSQKQIYWKEEGRHHFTMISFRKQTFPQHSFIENWGGQLGIWGGGCSWMIGGGARGREPCAPCSGHQGTIVTGDNNSYIGPRLRKPMVFELQ